VRARATRASWFWNLERAHETNTKCRYNNITYMDKVPRKISPLVCMCFLQSSIFSHFSLAQMNTRGGRGDRRSRPNSTASLESSRQSIGKEHPRRRVATQAASAPPTPQAIITTHPVIDELVWRAERISPQQETNTNGLARDNHFLHAQNPEVELTHNHDTSLTHLAHTSPTHSSGSGSREDLDTIPVSRRTKLRCSQDPV